MGVVRTLGSLSAVALVFTPAGSGPGDGDELSRTTDDAERASAS